MHKTSLFRARNFGAHYAFMYGCFKENDMLYWTLVFLVVALVAGALGFGGIAGASAGIAQILFFVFLALLAISVVAGLLRRAG